MAKLVLELKDKTIVQPQAPDDGHEGSHASIYIIGLPWLCRQHGLRAYPCMLYQPRVTLIPHSLCNYLLLQWDKVPVELMHLHKGKESYMSRVYEVVVNHSKLIISVSLGAP